MGNANTWIHLTATHTATKFAKGIIFFSLKYIREKTSPETPGLKINYCTGLFVIA